jgi:hypothetical protein
MQGLRTVAAAVCGPGNDAASGNMFRLGRTVAERFCLSLHVSALVYYGVGASPTELRDTNKESNTCAAPGRAPGASVLLGLQVAPPEMQPLSST